jgi:hypothetical protein
LFKYGSKPKGANSEREDALDAFGRAAASRPFHPGVMQAPRERVLQVGGEELLVEACMTAAMFEGVTKIVDGTVRKPWSKGMTFVVGFALGVIRNMQVLLGYR